MGCGLTVRALPAFHPLIAFAPYLVSLMIGFLFQILLLVGAAAAVLYIVAFAAASAVSRRTGRGVPDVPPPAQWPRLAVFIPAYKEDAVIVDTARRAAFHDYSGDVDVHVLADSLQPDTLAALDDIPVEVVPIDVAASTKARAINVALEQIPVGRYDAVVVLDADNVMAPGCLQHLGRHIAAGAQAVQGRRIAKNGATGWAQLDGFSEALNNQLFRRGHRALGLSAALIGSGMALETERFRHVMRAIDTPAGFDKAIELQLLQQGHTIAYAPRAVVYDEKVSQGEAFVGQRTRWFRAQWRYLRRHLLPGLRAAVGGGSFDYVDKVAQMLLPPRGLLLGGSVAIALAYAVGGAPGWAAAWTALVGLLVLALFTALPHDRSDLRWRAALRQLPSGLLRAGQALARSRRALRPNTRTRHHTVDLPE